ARPPVALRPPYILPRRAPACPRRRHLVGRPVPERVPAMAQPRQLRGYAPWPAVPREAVRGGDGGHVAVSLRGHVLPGRGPRRGAAAAERVVSDDQLDTAAGASDCRVH